MFKEIDELKRKLDVSRPLTKAEVERLYNDFKIDFTYNSNAIEGSTITLDETYAILEGKITIGGKSTKEYLDTVNHGHAFDFLLKVIKENYEFDERLIKEIHSIVLANDNENRGSYRRVPVRVGMHRPTEALNIPIEMEQLLKDYLGENKMHLVEKVADFHLKFESIHPFIDGNGRTGRLLLNFELMRNGYPPINIKFEDRERYYKAFEDYHKTGEGTLMTELVKDRVTDELECYLNIMGIKEQTIEAIDCEQEVENIMKF